MDIESKLWRVVSYHDAGGYAQITQKASGVTRTVLRSSLPGADTLALCHELTFNRLCREAFHGEK